MTTKEMKKRMSTLTHLQIEEIIQLIEMGFGAEGIKHETNLTIEQINAVFQYHSTL